MIQKIHIQYNKKGTAYVSINGDKGRKRYKYIPGTKLDDYKNYYETYTKQKGRQPTIKEYITHKYTKKIPIQKKKKQGIKIIRRKPKIDKIIKKGITRATIKNIYNTNNLEIKNAYKKLLKPLVKDKGLLELLCTEENINKLRYRFEHRIIFNGQPKIYEGEYEPYNTELTTITNIGKKNTKQVIQQITQQIPPGSELNETRLFKLLDRLKEQGYNYHHKDSGRVSGARLEIIFRRG